MSSDLVGIWHVPLKDNVHTIEFEHGTATGKRVIRINGQEVVRKDWMFKLVGDEHFWLNDETPCMIKIEPQGIFMYVYSLVVNGKPLESFKENQSKICNTWLVFLPENIYRVVLEKGTLDVWVNGEKLETTGEFVDSGTEINFNLGSMPAKIKAVHSGSKKEGIIYTLIVNDDIIQPTE